MDSPISAKNPGSKATARANTAVDARKGLEMQVFPGEGMMYKMNEIVAKITAADNALNSYLVKFRGPWFATTSRIITWAGSSPFLILLCVIILLFQRRACLLLPYFLIAEIVELMVIIPLRYFVKRKRPHSANLYRYLPSWNKYSFPSQHASRMFALTMILWFNYTESIYYMTPVAILVCFTRLALEKHYLSDILVGAAVGLLAGVVAVQGMRCLT
jgi:undecaprenyl-diphosphatase